MAKRKERSFPRLSLPCDESDQGGFWKQRAGETQFGIKGTSPSVSESEGVRIPDLALGNTEKSKEGLRGSVRRSAET